MTLKWDQLDIRVERYTIRAPTQEIASDIDGCGVVETVIRHPNVPWGITIAYRYQLRTRRQADADAVPILK